MSGYDWDSKIVFVTLAIGEEYLEKSMTLVQSVIKFTHSELYIVTDLPELAQSHANYYGKRVKVVDIHDYSLYTSHINGKFNYHLKSVALWTVSRMCNEVMVYVDADTFLFGWDSSISRYINGFEETLMCRFRERVSDNTSLARFVPDKAAAHGVDFTTIDARLAVETVMVLTRGALTTNFLQVWKDITDFSIKNEIDPFIEAFELALAIDRSTMNTINVNNKTPFADSFRTVHNNKLISTNII
jgi:hypothetical protein